MLSLQAVKDKQCLRMLERFHRTVQSLLKTVSMEEAEGTDGKTDQEMAELTRKLSETQARTPECNTAAHTALVTSWVSCLTPLGVGRGDSPIVWVLARQVVPARKGNR